MLLVRSSHDCRWLPPRAVVALNGRNRDPQLSIIGLVALTSTSAPAPALGSAWHERPQDSSIVLDRRADSVSLHRGSLRLAVCDAAIFLRCPVLPPRKFLPRGAIRCDGGGAVLPVD